MKETKPLLRVLLAEDSVDDADMTLSVLRNGGYEVDFVRVDREPEFRQALYGRTWDLVISDFNMPDFSAFSVLRIVNESGFDIPVLIVSGVINETEAVEAMRSGAHDYLMKDKLGRLVPAIDREIKEAANRRRLRESEEQLRQAQKMEAIGRLAGGIAHDFNNILGVQLLYCDSIHDRLSDPSPDPLNARNEIRAEILEIRKATERAASLTRQLLSFSRKRAVEYKVFDLNQSVREIEKMLHRLIGEDVTLSVHLEEGVGNIRMDPGQIEQVIMNLAVNARDAMPRGGRLTISTAGVNVDEEGTTRFIGVPSGSYVLLKISDTGCGMDERTKERIFEPFFTTKGPGSGTGLGLFTVYGIVQQSGGTISIETKQEEGTTFWILFPQTQLEAELSKKSQAAFDSRSDAQGTVLLMEDQESLRNVIRDHLEAKGYTVMAPPGSSEALSLIENYEGQIDLVLADVVMPGLSGPDLVQKLLTRKPGLKVLFMSGYPNDQLEYFALSEKDVHVLQKPFSFESLMKKILELRAPVTG